MSAVGLHSQELALMNNSFIVPKYIAAPYTTIQNRAQVLDASNMLQAVMGVERIPFKGINLLQKEFGANGEPVWELESKDTRVRFVGSGWYDLSDSRGNCAINTNAGELIEVVFYGTGLNVLTNVRDTNDRGFTYYVDDGVGTLLSMIGSTVLNQRNYSPYIVTSVVSGLSLGWHTVKMSITLAGGTFFSGIEILNQSTSLTIASGAFIVYFSKPFKNINYSMTQSTRITGGSSNRNISMGYGSEISTSFCLIRMASCTTNTASSDTLFSVEFKGELIDE